MPPAAPTSETSLASGYKSPATTICSTPRLCRAIRPHSTTRPIRPIGLRGFLFFLAVTGLAGSEFDRLPVAGAAEPPAPKLIRSVEGITEYRLENGLKILLFPDPSKPTVTVNLTVFVGSRHEGYGEAGMAHLLEHMLFKGTPTHPAVPKVHSRVWSPHERLAPDRDRY